MGSSSSAVRMLRCTVVLLLVATLAKSQLTPDPMQQFWWPSGCADPLPLGAAGVVPGPGPRCCMTLAPPDTTYGPPCVFPFKFDGVEYNACTFASSENLWCATEVDDNGDMVPNRYGDCEPGSIWKTGPPCKKTCICHDEGFSVCKQITGNPTTKEGTETTQPGSSTSGV